MDVVSLFRPMVFWLLDLNATCRGVLRALLTAYSLATVSFAALYSFTFSLLHHSWGLVGLSSGYELDSLAWSYEVFNWLLQMDSHRVHLAVVLVCIYEYAGRSRLHALVATA